MPTGTFYAYALLDPRESPPRPFYVGKGNGSRAYAHLAEDGEGRKVQRIREIKAAGQDVVVKQLVSDLSEPEACPWVYCVRDVGEVVTVNRFFDYGDSKAFNELEKAHAKIGKWLAQAQSQFFCGTSEAVVSSKKTQPNYSVFKRPIWQQPLRRLNMSSSQMIGPLELQRLKGSLIACW